MGEVQVNAMDYHPLKWSDKCSYVVAPSGARPNLSNRILYRLNSVNSYTQCSAKKKKKGNEVALVESHVFLYQNKG